MCSFTKRSAALQRLVLKPPQSPRSEVTTSRSAFFTSRFCCKGLASASEIAVRRPSTSPSFLAYGRAATTFSWARRSFAAETIFIALVILLGIFYRNDTLLYCFKIRHAWRPSLLRSKFLLEFIECGSDLGLYIVIDRLLVTQGGKESSPACHPGTHRVPFRIYAARKPDSRPHSRCWPHR